MAKKPKWIEEGTTNELAVDAMNQLTELEPNKQTKRAIKALEEIIERTADGDEETVANLLDTVVAKANAAKELYEAEVEAIGVIPEDDEEDDEEVEDIEEDEEEEVEVDLDGMSVKQLKAFAKDNDVDLDGVKGKANIIEAIEDALGEDEEVEEEDEDDEEEIDLEEMSLNELRGLAKTYNIKTKGKKKPQLIEAIIEAVEADEDEEDEAEEFDYDSMSLKELKALAKSRGLKVPSKPRKPKLIELLENDDEA